MRFTKGNFQNPDVSFSGSSTGMINPDLAYSSLEVLQNTQK